MTSYQVRAWAKDKTTIVHLSEIITEHCALKTECPINCQFPNSFLYLTRDYINLLLHLNCIHSL